MFFHERNVAVLEVVLVIVEQLHASIQHEREQPSVAMTPTRHARQSTNVMQEELPQAVTLQQVHDRTHVRTYITTTTLKSQEYKYTTQDSNHTGY
jgi:hypothetical protein